MPRADKDYLQQHPLIEIINVHWGERSVTLNWAWLLEPSGGSMGEPCHPKQRFPDVPLISGEWITALTPPAMPTHTPAEHWTESAQPGQPNAVGFGAFEWQTAWIAEEGLGTIDPIIKSGKGAGSVDFPLFGWKLNGIPACYVLPGDTIDSINSGQSGVSRTNAVSFPAENTGRIITLSWPSISITNTETGEIWTKSRYNVNGTFWLIQLTLTYLDFEQNEDSTA